jgi:hypothetical protein
MFSPGTLKQRINSARKSHLNDEDINKLIERDRNVPFVL